MNTRRHFLKQAGAAATWSSIAVLSEQSVADRSRPVDFPDFTKGKWKTTPPIQIMGV